jgi:hypothetical protein
MTTELESELRAVLTGCAEEVPPDVVERLGRVRYRVPNHSRRAVGLLGAGVVTAAALSVAFGAVGFSRHDAFASWTAAPKAAASGQAAAADTACLSSVEKGADESLTGPRAPGSQTYPGYTASSVWRTRLTDLRGPFSFVVVEAASHGHLAGLSTCFVAREGSAGRVLSSVGSAAWSNASGELAAPGSISVPMSETIGMSGNDFVNDAAGAHVSYVVGDAGASVRRVALHLSDHSIAFATVQNQIYAAWWPSSAWVTSATVTTARGSTQQRICAPPAPGAAGLAACS